MSPDVSRLVGDGPGLAEGVMGGGCPTRELDMTATADLEPAAGSGIGDGRVGSARNTRPSTRVPPED